MHKHFQSVPESFTNEIEQGLSQEEWAREWQQVVGGEKWGHEKFALINFVSMCLYHASVPHNVL